MSRAEHTLLGLQPVTVSSSEDDGGGLELAVSNDENSRDTSRRAEEFCLDSSDFLHIDEDLNLEELMKQKVRAKFTERGGWSAHTWATK